ncbi:MAG TPA: DivIVA domain-containing protein [Mycobacteriales bacterium]|nr:DivIVA domain-containing protein [Mycobacteriales bacterium]
MPLTPQDVQQKEFRQQFRGYNEVEVDAFLDEVETELGRLIAENDDLRQRLAQAGGGAAESDVMLRRTLLLAQRTADETVGEAQTEAQRLLAEAQAQAQATVSAAQGQAAAALSDLDRRRQQLEQHIEGLRAFEREYRTRLKAYLESQLSDLDGRGQAAGAAAGAQGVAPAPSSSPEGADPAAARPAASPPARHPAPAPTPRFTAVSPPPGLKADPAGPPEIPQVAP